MSATALALSLQDQLSWLRQVVRGKRESITPALTCQMSVKAISPKLLLSGLAHLNTSSPLSHRTTRASSIVLPRQGVRSSLLSAATGEGQGQFTCSHNPTASCSYFQSRGVRHHNHTHITSGIVVGPALLFSVLEAGSPFLLSNANTGCIVAQVRGSARSPKRCS